MRAAFWNLRYVERYDVTHLVNLRRLLRHIADGGILGCMMFVPSTGWNVARCCGRPLRSSAQPWGIEMSRVSMSLSDLSCLDTGNRIMRTVIKLARHRQRFNVPWAIENQEKSLCWMTSQFQELSKMRNVYKMTSDFCALGTKWRKRTTVLAGHVDSADVWALDTMRCRGRKRCSFTGDEHVQLVGYDSSHQCSRTHRSRIFPMKLASRLANLLLGPTLTGRMQRTCCDVGMQRER